MMNTSVKLEARVKKITEGEYFVEDTTGGLLAKTWREDIANQIAADLNGKDLDLLNGKAGEILIVQLDELAALRAENAQLRELLAPLAAAATVFDEINHTSDTDGLWVGNLKTGKRVIITLGNARAARSALKVQS